MKNVLSTIAAVALFSLIATAQRGLTGQWKGTTGQGQAVALDLKVNGGRLTGTLTLSQQTVTISEGKIDKAAFTFKAPVKDMNDRIVVFSGEVKGDEIALTPEGARAAAILKRVK